MMTRSEIEQQVIAFLRDTLQLDEAQLVSSANLKADLGLTSLDANVFLFFVNSTFALNLVFGDVASFATLDDIYTYIESHLS